MANHKSAQKRIRQTVTKTKVNSDRRSRIRTAIKKVYDLVAAKDKKELPTALKTAESELMKGVTKGLVKKNNAARKVSRLVKHAKANA
jgi:small subunit ribosomal protein S20